MGLSPRGALLKGKRADAAGTATGAAVTAILLQCNIGGSDNIRLSRMRAPNSPFTMRDPHMDHRCQPVCFGSTGSCNKYLCTYYS